MKSRIYIIVVALVAMTLASCRSSRRASKEIDNATIETVVGGGKTQTVTQNVSPTGVDAINAKMNMNVKYGKNSIALGGTYRLKRNEVVQLNLTYTMIVTLNVGTIEFTPDYFMVVDKMNKRYCRASYAEVPQLRMAGIDFYTIQSIFWGESKEINTPALKAGYADWQKLGAGQFPGRMELAIDYSGNNMQSTLKLSNIRADHDWQKTDIDTSRYTQMSVDAVMKAILSLVK